MPPSRRYLAAGAAALAAAGLAFGLWRVDAGPRVDAWPVERVDILQTVVASGRVESPRRVEIGAAVTGTVAAIPVAEGERVAAGQALVVLDAREARAALDQARFAVAQAEARLAQLRTTGLPVAAEGVRQAEVHLANAESTLARSRELFARGFIGQAALDEAQRGRDVAESQWKSALLQRDSQSGGGTEERTAHAALEQARASLRLAQARLDLATIAAPVDGVLIARKVEIGAVVQPGKALMVLSPAGELQLVVQLDEKNLQLVALG
ncbi:MAG TPA: biotin/lipoyl-binding protein, partial [Myxococcota bacterium]|nr:biotin/lipoyl-binding protein [Myxococcota bacterium]